MKTQAENVTKYSEVKRQMTDRPWTDRTEQHASKEECIK